jgi:stress-induced-phosphoprotein 1
MKQYHKCLETYDQGLKLDPENPELLEGIKRTIEAINRRQELEGEEAEKEAARAASDPEIQQILADPVMRKVLSDLSSSPQAAATYMRDPVIMAKLQKLIAAGIVKTK